MLRSVSSIAAHGTPMTAKQGAALLRLALLQLVQLLRRRCCSAVPHLGQPPAGERLRLACGLFAFWAATAVCCEHQVGILHKEESFQRRSGAGAGQTGRPMPQ